MDVDQPKLSRERGVAGGVREGTDRPSSLVPSMAASTSLDEPALTSRPSSKPTPMGLGISLALGWGSAAAPLTLLVR